MDEEMPLEDLSNSDLVDKVFNFSGYPAVRDIYLDLARDSVGRQYIIDAYNYAKANGSSYVEVTSCSSCYGGTGGAGYIEIDPSYPGNYYFINPSSFVAPFANPDNKLTEAMIADLTQNVLRIETGAVQRFKVHVTDPLTGGCKCSVYRGSAEKFGFSSLYFCLTLLMILMLSICHRGKLCLAD